MEMQLLKRENRKFDPEFPHFMDDVMSVLDVQRKISPGDIYIICVPRAEVIPEEIHNKMVTDFILEHGKDPVNGEVPRFAFKNRIIAKETCPYPTFDQTLFKWTKSGDKLELLWTLPPREDCQEMRDDAANIAPEWKENLKYVMDYFDGSLRKMADELNKADQLSQGIVLRTYDDAQMTKKQHHKKLMESIFQDRKRKKLF
jgi:hypothetical protein